MIKNTLKMSNDSDEISSMLAEKNFGDGESPAEIGNNPLIEMEWARKTVEHLEIYFNILCSVDPRFLNLTPFDEEIYKKFREDFPDLFIKVLDEDEMKSSSGKEKWRNYCENFKNKVEDYNFGTMLRKDCTKDYSPENSILVPRIQFLAVELARNKEGYNDDIRKIYGKNKS